jgi:FAD/FMN-containing dehydrogenase
MFTRVLRLGAVLFLLASSPRWAADSGGTIVNDIHAQLNATHVESIAKPVTIPEIQAVVRKARRQNKAISITGGRHAMGGQQFGADTVLIDMSGMNRVVSFDRKKGLLEVEAGIQWPALVDYLLQAQKGQWPQWGIVQKQTGADRLSIGGALSANVHGRGLRLKPFVSDVESFRIVDAKGNLLSCSRTENPELFRLVAGGYGLYGVIATVKMRLTPRKKVERVVQVIALKDLMPSFEKRMAEGYLFGDFQYSIDYDSDDFLRKGVFSCYRPVDDKTPMPEVLKELAAVDWDNLYYLAHTDRKKAFDRYAGYYLSTSGQLY